MMSSWSTDVGTYLKFEVDDELFMLRYSLMNTHPLISLVHLIKCLKILYQGLIFQNFKSNQDLDFGKDKNIV